MSDEEGKIDDQLSRIDNWDKFSTFVAITLKHFEKALDKHCEDDDIHIQNYNDFKLSIVQRLTELETYAKARARLSLALSGLIPAVIAIWKVVELLTKK